MRTIILITFFLPFCCIAQKIFLQDIKPDKTVTWHSNQDSFYLRFDRAEYFQFIKGDTSLRPVLTKIKSLLNSDSNDILLDTIFATIARTFKHDDWNSRIVYDDFIMLQLDKGAVAVFDMLSNKQVNFIRKKKHYYDKRLMSIEYFSDKRLVFEYRYFIVHF